MRKYAKRINSLHSFWNFGFGKFFRAQISGSFGSIAFKEVIICQLNFGETFSVDNVIFWLIFIGHKCATSKKKFWIVAILDLRSICVTLFQLIANLADGGNGPNVHHVVNQLNPLELETS